MDRMRTLADWFSVGDFGSGSRRKGTAFGIAARKCAFGILFILFILS